jgi:hypothetical protein
MLRMVTTDLICATKLGDEGNQGRQGRHGGRYRQRIHIFSRKSPRVVRALSSLAPLWKSSYRLVLLPKSESVGFRVREYSDFPDEMFCRTLTEGADMKLKNSAWGHLREAKKVTQVHSPACALPNRANLSHKC